jgi:hypothetical protein
MAGWSIKGDYFEACNCDFLCPCITSNMQAWPTEGDCRFALAFEVAEGAKDGVKLDGVAFVVLAQTDGPMAKGGWTVGLIVDERADEKQRQAITEIASGQAGGPMAAMAPLIGTFAGVEAAPIRIEKQGRRRKLSVPGMVEQAIDLLAGPEPDKPICIDNVGHPANSRLALARAESLRFKAFGIEANHGVGKNGHAAPFAWSA